MWSKLQNDKPEAPDQGEGTHYWTIQVVLDDVQADKYKETGLFPKFKRNQEHDIVLEEGLRQVKLKKSTTFGVNGKPKQPVVVVDVYGNPFTDLIGNGSVCNVQCSAHTWTRDGKTNTSLELQAVQVVELIAYDEEESSGDTFIPSFDYEKQKKVDIKDVKVAAETDDVDVALDSLDFDD
ncbi:MAG: hypothetical protein ACKVJK_20890 [Methylophagaceae bacterium]